MTQEYFAICSLSSILRKMQLICTYKFNNNNMFTFVLWMYRNMNVFPLLQHKTHKYDLMVKSQKNNTAQNKIVMCEKTVRLRGKVS